MGLKFLSLLFLLVAAAYAAPALEDELDDPFTEEEVDDVMDDESDAEDPVEDEDEDEEEEDPARKKKKPKYAALFGARAYCVCKRPAKKGDALEDEASEEAEDVSDHIEKITKDVEFSDPKSSRKRKFKAFLKKLVSPYFGAVKLSCYCTKNRAVVRLLRYLKVASIIGRRQKYAFWKRVKYLIAAVKKQKKKSG